MTSTLQSSSRSSVGANARLQELEQQFAALDAQIGESPVKQALSVLHALVHEVRREAGRSPDGAGRQGRTLRDIIDLYRTAPAMEGAAENSGLPVGTRAPDFALRDAAGNTVRLSDYRGKPVVLVFYPLDWSPGCSQQLDLYQHDLAEFTRRGAVLLGISVDSIYSHGAWAAVRGLKFPLLADFEPKGEVARRYQVWRDKDGFSERALYVVDGEGIIRYAHISPELGKIPDIYELYRVLGEVTGQAAAETAALAG